MEKIFSYVDQNLNRFMEELFVLLRQPSINARWEGVEECSQLLVGMMDFPVLGNPLIDYG